MNQSAPTKAAIALVCIGLSCFASDAPAAAAESCPRVEIAEVRSAATRDTRPIRDPTRRRIHVDRQPIVDLGDIRSARLSRESEVMLSYSPAGAERLTRATTHRSGMRFAFIFGSEALMVVRWEGEYGLDAHGVQLSLRDRRMARRVVKTINRCAEANGT